VVGIGFLALAKTKNMLKGYSSPKPFDVSETEKCAEYDINVVKHWLSHLQKYTHSDTFLPGKNVLELGPGSDLGVGIYLLSMGVAKYNACDVNDLLEGTPDRFYRFFLARLKSDNSQANMDLLEKQLNEAIAGRPSQLNYVVRNDFDLVSAFGTNSIDLVFSQAAFEHFDDIDTTVAQLSKVCRPGAVVVAEIDLKTHSRWIRDKDPNNIYRYSRNVYEAFWFRGIPNRVRPYQYKETFERFGWTDVSIISLSRLDGRNSNISGLNGSFVGDINQMDYLFIMLCARKPETV
jgi:SAM-dependent methyltransferase